MNKTANVFGRNILKFVSMAFASWREPFNWGGGGGLNLGLMACRTHALMFLFDSSQKYLCSYLVSMLRRKMSDYTIFPHGVGKMSSPLQRDSFGPRENKELCSLSLACVWLVSGGKTGRLTVLDLAVVTQPMLQLVLCRLCSIKLSASSIIMVNLQRDLTTTPVHICWVQVLIRNQFVWHMVLFLGLSCCARIPMLLPVKCRNGQQQDLPKVQE